MGFKVIRNDGDTGSNIYINLSKEAFDIINIDIDNFDLKSTKRNVAGFFNKIFTNFHQKANATISDRLINKQEEFEEQMYSDDFSHIDDMLKNDLIDLLLDIYEDELKSKTTSYEKGEQLRIRFQGHNVDILETLSEDEYYKSAGEYLKNVFEEYSRLPSNKREEIYFDEEFKIIRDAINSKRKLIIYNRPKLNTKINKLTQVSMLFTPYNILQDKADNYNYLVGFSELLLPDGTYDKKRLSSIRISRIDKISLRKSIRGRISKDEEKFIKEEINNKGVQYLVGDLTNIKVKFTNKGLEIFKTLVHLKPNNYEVLDDNIYLFKMTELHAIFYFYRFGRDIEVLEPLSLRQEFIKRYKEALNKYI